MASLRARQVQTCLFHGIAPHLAPFFKTQLWYNEKSGEVDMKSLDEQVLKVTKEIVAKFIEVGRVSPASFDETFKTVYRSVKEAILDHGIEEEELTTSTIKQT